MCPDTVVRAPGPLPPGPAVRAERDHMRHSRRRGVLLAVAALTASAVQLTPAAVAAPAPVASRCGPLDVVFVLDDTGSMGGAIGNLKTGVNAIVNDVVT